MAKDDAITAGGRFQRYANYVPDLIRAYLPAWVAEHEAAMSIDPYLRGEHPLPIASSSQSSAEREQLRWLAKTPYARTLLNISTQGLNLKGLKVEGSDETPAAWKDFWLANKMGARQNGIWRPAVGFGRAYSVVLPGYVGIDQREAMTIKNFSPKTMTAIFGDPFDEYPMAALNGVPQWNENNQQYWLFTVYDEEAVHFAYVYELMSGVDARNVKIAYLESRPHESEVCPVVFHTPLVDDDGGSRSELLPFLPIIKRLDQSVYDRLLIQRQAAWKVRYASGVKKPSNKSAVAKQQAILKAGDLLTSEDPNAKFGTLDASSMNEHLTTRESDLKDLAASSQTPSFMLTGNDMNMQAEALSAITSGYQQRIEQYKRSLSMSLEKVFELGGHQDSSIAIPEGATLEPRWAEFRPYSLTQVSDALGKLAQQLSVPPEELLEYVPFFSDGDVERIADGIQDARDEAMAQAQLAAAGQDEAGAKPANSSGQQKDTNAGNSFANKRS